MSLTERFHKRNGYIEKKQAPSNSYHNYFEGYNERYVMNSNGHGRHIERTYTGEYYCRSEGRLEYHSIKIFYVFAYIYAMAVQIYSMTRPLLINYIVYVVSCQVLVLLFSFPSGFFLFFYILSNKNMTVSEYKQIRWLRISLSSMGGALLLQLLSYIIYLILNGFSDGYALILCLALITSSAVAIIVIVIMERKAVYEIISPAGKPVSGSETID